MGIQECYDFEDYFNASDPFADDAADAVKWFDEDYPSPKHSNAIQFFAIMLTIIAVVEIICGFIIYYKSR